MQDQHTQEPWYASKEDGNWRVMAADENGGYTLADMYCDDPEANSRRIVACVNACAGIPTEELVRAKYLNTASYAMRQKAEKHRDELLAALKKFLDSHEECADFDGFTAQLVSMDDYHEAQEAIASVKGGAA